MKHDKFAVKGAAFVLGRKPQQTAKLPPVIAPKRIGGVGPGLVTAKNASAVGVAPVRVQQLPPQHPSSPIRRGAPPVTRVAASRFMHGLVAAGAFGDDPQLPDSSTLPPASANVDAFGVPSDHVPAAQAWVSHDLWEGLPDDQVWQFADASGGTFRATHRLAWPVADNSLALCFWEFNEFGGLLPQWRHFDNCLQQHPRDQYADQFHYDDLRWDAHAPYGPALDVISSTTLLLPVDSTGIGPYGSSQGGELYQTYPVNWRFQKWPADMWRLDLDADVPVWFHPFMPVPVDLLSYYVAQLVPVGVNASAADFWAQQMDRLAPYLGASGDPMPTSWAYHYVQPQGLNYWAPLDGTHPGRGGITVYRPEDIPKPGTDGTTQLGPIGTFTSSPTTPSVGGNDIVPVDQPPPAADGSMPAGVNVGPPPGVYDPNASSYPAPPPSVDDGGGIAFVPDSGAPTAPTYPAPMAWPADQLPPALDLAQPQIDFSQLDLSQLDPSQLDASTLAQLVLYLEQIDQSNQYDDGSGDDYDDGSDPPDGYSSQDYDDSGE